MPTAPIEYDIFVSYARLDNNDGWIKAYVEALAEQFKLFTGGRELRYFWDTDRIPEFSHWQTEIFNKGIANSKLFLAFLSPNYFVSEVCRREWRAWIEREIGMHILSDGAAPIYIVEIPAMFGKPMPAEHETARQVAELCHLPLPHDLFVRDAEAVVREFRRRQLHAVQPFYNAGLEALKRQDLLDQLNALVKRIDTQSEMLRVAADSESTVPTYNSNFTGRVDELVELRNMLVDGSTGVVAGIHGLGGIGKTELAFTFAHAYAGVYPGGRYYVRCEGQSSLLNAFTKFADGPFHDEISDAERNDIEANFNAVLRALKRRLQELGFVLLVLDNVSDPDLLRPQETSRITKLGPNLHLLATTRLPQAIGIKTLMLGEMKPGDAVALLEKFRPFADDTERAAAVEIVRRLGGFALAIELVASRLLVKKSLTYVGVLQGLGLESLDTYAEDKDVVLQRHNHEKRLEQVLLPTLADLSPEARCVLQFAAYLPPDHVVLPWLRDLVLEHYPKLGELGFDGEDPWQELIHALFRLSLFSGVYAENEYPTTARLHRLIGDFLRRDVGPDIDKELRAYLAKKSDAIYETSGKPPDWDLDGLLESVPHVLNIRPDHRLAVDAMFLSNKVLDYRSLPLAKRLLEDTGAVIRKLAESDETNAQMQRDIAVSYSKIATYQEKAGLPEAVENWRKCLQVFDDMIARGLHVTPQDLGFVDWLRKKLG